MLQILRLQDFLAGPNPHLLRASFFDSHSALCYNHYQYISRQGGLMTFPPIPESIAGVTFHDPTLLLRALTHRSFLNEHPDDTIEDNERLEFLGDAVISLVTAEHLYNRYPDYREGELTNLRAAIVRRETLAEFARAIHLDQHLLLGHGEEESGGRSRPAILCDTFEAFVGALYLDQGYRRVEEFLRPFIEKAVEELSIRALKKDARSQLQELTQARFQVTPRYRTIAEFGPDHAKEFVVEVFVGSLCAGRGRGNSKQSAAKNAAAHAVGRLDPISDLAELPPLEPWGSSEDGGNTASFEDTGA